VCETVDGVPIPVSTMRRMCCDAEVFPVVLGADGSYSVNTDTVPKSQLDQKLHSVFDTRPQKLMFIKAAGNRKYQDVVEAMDIARGAGQQLKNLGILYDFV